MTAYTSAARPVPVAQPCPSVIRDHVDDEIPNVAQIVPARGHRPARRHANTSSCCTNATCCDTPSPAAGNTAAHRSRPNRYGSAR